MNFLQDVSVAYNSTAHYTDQHLTTLFEPVPHTAALDAEHINTLQPHFLIEVLHITTLHAQHATRLFKTS